MTFYMFDGFRSMSTKLLSRLVTPFGPAQIGLNFKSFGL